MEILDRFFEALAMKFCKEQKLSDLIWTMCSTNELFRNIFLEFCFEKNVCVEGEIIREFNKNGSIPDFYFKDINGDEYIIENKIYDHGDHFEQYINEFPTATRAFIANYTEGQHKGWFIKNWKDFIKHLENKISTKNSNIEEFELIQSFVLYLKSVTYYQEAKTMNFSNLSSLRYFYDIISELIEQMGFQNYNVPSAINSDYYGKHFYYPNKNEENVYIWLGLFIPEPSGVYIEFRKFEDENWCPKTEQNKIKKLTSGKYYDNTSIEDHGLYIHLKDEYYEKLCDNNINVNVQKDIIKCFLVEILDILK
jgi:hypothetical protein